MTFALASFEIGLSRVGRYRSLLFTPVLPDHHIDIVKVDDLEKHVEVFSLHHSAPIGRCAGDDLVRLKPGHLNPDGELSGEDYSPTSTASICRSCIRPSS